MSLFTSLGLSCHQWALTMKGNPCYRAVPRCHASRIKCTALSPALQPVWISLVHSTVYLPCFLTPTPDTAMPDMQSPGLGRRVEGYSRETKLMRTMRDSLHASISSSLALCSNTWSDTTCHGKEKLSNWPWDSREEQTIKIIPYSYKTQQVYPRSTD